MSGRLMMQLVFFRRAVRAESTRALLTEVVDCLRFLLIYYFVGRAACRQRAGVSRA